MRFKIALACAVACLAFAWPVWASAEAFEAGKAAKVALATRYMVLSHRVEHFRRTYTKQLQLAWAICHDDDCQSDLNQAISDAVARGADRYRAHAIEIMAEHYTSEQLQAAIKFVSSADGQAIVRMNDELTDDSAALAHSLSVEIHTDVSKHFCPTHLGVCSARAPSHARARAEQGT